MWPTEKAASFLTLAVSLQLTRCEGFAGLQHAALVLYGNEVQLGQVFDSGLGGHALEPIAAQEDLGILQLHLHKRQAKSSKAHDIARSCNAGASQTVRSVSFLQLWQITSLSN